MKVYLVQHGEAQPKAVDADRRLTDDGQHAVARVAAFAQQAGIEVFQIRHSGKNRAEETAAIWAGHLAPPGGVVAQPGLAPKDDVRPIAELLNREMRPLMFVGHRPFLDRLAGLLLAGDPDCRAVRLQKGGIVCLARDPKSWTWSVVWAITPALIP